MAIALFYNITLLLLGFNVVVVARHILHAFLVRRTFNHVPGPIPPSLLWGEEWDLYHSLPGSLYFNWHKRFGKVVAFTGAFGVCHSLIQIGLLANMLDLASSIVHHRPSSHLIHTRRSYIPVSEASRCSCLVPSVIRRGYSLG